MSQHSGMSNISDDKIASMERDLLALYSIAVFEVRSMLRTSKDTRNKIKELWREIDNINGVKPFNM